MPRLPLRLLKAARYAALAVALAGTALVVLAPFVGPSLTDVRWLVEPVAYVGVVILVLGLAAAILTYALSGKSAGPANGAPMRTWSSVTQDYFDTFSHDMGRPLRRILGKAREVRARLDESGKEPPQTFTELLDEIEQQAPSFRLMLANVRVLVELEDSAAAARSEPVDPAAIVRNVVDRYRYWTVDAIVADLDTRRYPYHVAVENWSSDLNIGTVVRNANAFGAATVTIVGNRRWNRRGAMVTDRYQHVTHVHTFEELAGWAADAQLVVVGIDNLPGSVPLEATLLPERCVLVFGQEGPGLSEAARRAAALVCSITQVGSTRSINAGVASGIAMHTWLRQHTLSP